MVSFCSSACTDCKFHVLGSNMHGIYRRESVIRKGAPKAPPNTTDISGSPMREPNLQLLGVYYKFKLHITSQVYFFPSHVNLSLSGSISKIPILFDCSGTWLLGTLSGEEAEVFRVLAVYMTY